MNGGTHTGQANGRRGGWDHSSDQRFVAYYASQSLTEANWRRLQRIRDTVGRFAPAGADALAVADIGCGPGAQSQLWAADGHRVHGLDVNAELIDLARQRAAQAGQAIDFRVGSATDLPWADGSMDVCLAPELLEHVPEWRPCLDEFARILRPGGVLFLSTTNRLCPVQQEFDLPLYSWYPAPVKRRVERLVTTTRPELANYATYPAVHWFTFYGLRRELQARGMTAFDRFDALSGEGRPPLARLALWAVTRLPPARFVGHLLTPYTRLVAVKHPAA